VLLTISIGLPYFLLSATSSLMQARYAGRSNSALPYKLFALSNLASLAGLLAYPFVIEPVFTLREQSAAWSIAYGIFSAFAMSAAAINARKGTSQGLARQPLAQATEGSGDAPSSHDKACMFCHGELAHRKPSPRHLTGFYLIISAGGAFGGRLISVAAPTLFRGYFEMPLALLACAALVTAVHVRRGWMAGTASVVLTLGIVVMTGYYVQGYAEGAVALDRNFYDWLRVKDVPKGDGSNFRYLLHGAIIHGGQFPDDNRRNRPTAYYGMSTGVAAAIRSLNDRPVRAGIIGLGSGILAAYSRPGDVYRFYEINPMVEKFARDYFTFLSAAQGKVEIVLGDARISLEREEVQNYDLLVVDAFSGDAIPVQQECRKQTGACSCALERGSAAIRQESRRGRTAS